MGNKSRGNKPAPSSGKFAEPQAPPNYNLETPKFCLKHLVSGYDVIGLDTAGQAAFARSLQTRASMTWQQITLADRHGMGLETFPVSRLRAPLPVAFQGEEKVLVLRYNGNLPMAGVRVRDVLHILWVEAKFGDLYDHGS